MYSKVTKQRVIAKARGMVREGCFTSPLALSETSIPVSRNNTRIRARPRPCTPDGMLCDKIGAMDRGHPHDEKEEQGNHLDRRHPIDKPHPPPDPAEVDHHHRSNHADDHHHVCGRLERLRHHAYHHIRQRCRYPPACECVTQPQKRSGNVARKRSKSGFNHSIGSAAGRDTAASLGKADGDCAHRDAAEDECNRRRTSHTGGKRPGCDENACSDHGVNCAGRQAPNADGAHQSGVASILKHGQTVAPGAKQSNKKCVPRENRQDPDLCAGAGADRLRSCGTPGQRDDKGEGETST